MGVDRFTQYSGCFKCSAKVEVDEDDEEVGECTKCKVIQCMDDTKRSISAQLMVKVDGSIMNLRAFNKVIYDITKMRESENITPNMLIKAQPFNIYHLNGIIQSVII